MKGLIAEVNCISKQFAGVVLNRYNTAIVLILNYGALLWGWVKCSLPFRLVQHDFDKLLSKSSAVDL